MTVHDAEASTCSGRMRALMQQQQLWDGIQTWRQNLADFGYLYSVGWHGSRVVSVLDSGAEGARVQIAVATLSGNSIRQTVHTHCASVHQAARLVAVLLRVAGVTAGLAESNGSLPPGL